MPGPPKRSNAYKKSVGSRKIHSGEDIAPEPLSEIPRAPSTLGKLGKRKWKEVCALQIQEQLLTEWDLSDLEMMCKAWEVWIEAGEDIAKNGFYQASSRTGYEQQRPIVAVRDKAMADYQRLSDKFGGNPAARSRIKRVAPQQKATANPFDGV